MVSVPLRGKEGAGQFRVMQQIVIAIVWMFPSPCGVRRVRDFLNGAGDERTQNFNADINKVSVPLRGKEGAGPGTPSSIAGLSRGFPSPCGVRRVRDPWFLETLYDAVFKVRF